MRLDVLASVAAWRALCEADLRTAQLILGAADATPEMFGLACFHAQQAAEKMLKALLTARGIGFSRTHDNVYLLGLTDEVVESELEDACALLAEYGVGPRYPGTPLGRSRADALAAIEACGLVVEWCGERCLV